MSNESVVILSAKRTPIGSFQGALSPATAPQLGTAAIKGALEASGLVAADIDEVIMGCVLPAGLGQAPARQAALGAGVPDSVPATTINKMCGSGMKSVMLAADDAILTLKPIPPTPPAPPAPLEVPPLDAGSAR